MRPTSVGKSGIDEGHRIVQTCNLTYCRSDVRHALRHGLQMSHIASCGLPETPATLPSAAAESPSERRRPFGNKIIYHDLGEGSKRQRRMVRSCCTCERALCSRLVSLLQRSPESASQVSGPRSLQRRPTFPTPALLDARRWSSWRHMSSTIGAEETFCVATQPLADVNGSASCLGWGTTRQDQDVSR